MSNSTEILPNSTYILFIFLHGGSSVSYTHLKSICLTGLKSSKKSTCDKYTSSIDTSANYYAKACVYSAASGVGIGVIAGLVAANIAFPPSVIITIVVAACGSGSSIIACVNALIDSNTYSNQAKNYFASVVTY